MVKSRTPKLLLAAVAFLFAGSAAFAQYDDMPPQPSEFGKCYAKCKIPDQYETVQTQVLVKEASTKKLVRPAVYETVTERVLVKEESKKLIPIPAQYETVTERVLVKEASTKIVERPATYRTIQEKMLVSPASGKWVKKRKYAGCISANPEDCYIMCWEEIPAQYKTLSKRVVDNPGSSDVVEIPAEYKTVTKKVLSSPANIREEMIPAEYKTVTKKVLATAATTDEQMIPAEYKTVSEKKLVQAGGFTRWTEILCEANTTSSNIRDVQSALSSRGYNPGPIDGVMGSQTKVALRKFQSDNGLPLGGGLNVATLKALGL